MSLIFNGRYFRDCTVNGNPPDYEYEELHLENSKTAFLLVDVYLDTGCGESAESAPDEHAQLWWKVAGNISETLEVARGVGLPVIYVANSSPKIELPGSAFGKHFKRGWNGDFDSAFAEGGVDNREFYGNRELTLLKYPSVLEPLSSDYYLRKHVYSGFFDSRLDTLLRNKGITTLIAVGFWANVCLLATSLDALYRNYDIIWIRECTLAGGDPSEEGDWTNTERFVKLFESIIGYSIGKDEFASSCRKK